MEHGVVSPPGKKWRKSEILELFKQGKSLAEVKQITGLPGRVLGGYKGLVRSPIYQGEPIVVKDDPVVGAGTEVGQTQGQGTPLTQPGNNGGGNPSGQTPVVQTPVELLAGPTEAQALTILQGKPYLIRVQNCYVTGKVLEVYQLTMAKGARWSVGEFLEFYTLRYFKEKYSIEPILGRLSEGLT